MTLVFLADYRNAEGYPLAGEDVSLPEVARSMYRIEAKLDKALDNHEQRINRLERMISTLIGISIGSAGGSIAAIATSILG